jgi:hypothetical protein
MINYLLIKKSRVASKVHIADGKARVQYTLNQRRRNSKRRAKLSYWQMKGQRGIAATTKARQGEARPGRQPIDKGRQLCEEVSRAERKRTL